MRDFLLWGSLAMCLFALWVMVRRDWLRLTLSTCRASAIVVDHHTGWEKGRIVYAAILRFSHEGGTCDVIDQVFSSKPVPPVGSRIEIHYPEGHPELARPPRVMMWLAVYILLIGLSVAIFAKVMDWLPPRA